MVMAVDIQEGNILIISIQEEGSLVEVGCIQEVVIQVVAELILAGRDAFRWRCWRTS